MSLIPNTLATFIALFPIANPIGAVPIFYTLTATQTSSERHQQALQTATNVVLVLAVFLVAGRWILEFFGISLNVLRLAGGLLVAHTAWEMVTVCQRLTPSEKDEAMEKEDISFTPMAVPLISGPGAIGVVTSLSINFNHWVEYLQSLIGIVLIGISLYLCLVLGEPLIKRLGNNGVGALNRVFGFFILAIGVRFIADGSISLLKEAFPIK
jgi:multiple antibiotic resistance protein